MKTLTNENYFSLENQMMYMGVSQFKAFEKCEAAALAEGDAAKRTDILYLAPLPLFAAE